MLLGLAIGDALGSVVMVVGYTVKGESFVADKPRAWTGSLAGLGGFDVAPDGKRLAVTLPVRPREAPRSDHTVVLLQNFLTSCGDVRRLTGDPGLPLWRDAARCDQASQNCAVTGSRDSRTCQRGGQAVIGAPIRRRQAVAGVRSTDVSILT